MKSLFSFTLLLSLILLATCQTLQSLPQDTSDPECESRECAPSVLLPFTPLKVVGVILIVLIGGLANATGIGGGAKLNPVLLIFFDYNKNTAITIVFGLIFGSALGNFLNIVRRRDPKTGKPLINYDLVLLCMPLMMLGTTIGVVLGRAAASIIIVIGIVAVSVNNFVKISAKAKKQYREETENKKIQKAANPDEEKINQGVTNLVGGTPSSTSTGSEETEEALGIKEQPELVPVKKVAILVGLMLVIMLLSLLRGTKNQPSVIGIPYCSAGYWGIFGATLAVCFVVSYFCQRILKREINMQEQRQMSIHKREDGDFELAESNMKRLTVSSLMTGVVAGILGIGGGLILGPIFLSLGVAPQALAATTGFFILQTSFISLFMSSLYGDVLLSEQLFFFTIALVGSFLVSLVLNWFVKKTNRSSLLLFTLLGVVALTIIATPSFEVWKNWENPREMFEFNSIC